jgi:hypothetical protein
MIDNGSLGERSNFCRGDIIVFRNLQWLSHVISVQLSLDYYYYTIEIFFASKCDVLFVLETYGKPVWSQNYRSEYKPS